MEEIKESLSYKSVDDVLKMLRLKSLDEFGEILWRLPSPDMPDASKILPRMATVDIQTAWTGNSGEALLEQSLAFIRSSVNNYEKISGRSIQDTTVLDYGCGWARLMRLMYYYISPENLYGFDPWGKSIEICKSDGVLGNLEISDYLPKELPCNKVTFDFIYVFSIFTHLSERAMKCALGALRKRISKEGVIVITIRPKEYWPNSSENYSETIRNEMMRSHDDKGFAYTPHGQPPVEGELIYGDSSMTIDYIKNNFSDWNVVLYEQDKCDTYQIIVYMSPA